MKQKKTIVPESSTQMDQLLALRRVSEEYSHLGKDYLLTHVTTDASLFYSRRMRRLDGYTLIICLKGSITMTIDLETVEIPPMSIFFITPDRMFNPIKWTGDDLDVYLLFMSSKFVNEINIDLKSIDTNIFTVKRSYLTVEREKIDMLLRYCDMLHFNADHPSNYNRHIAQSLMAAAAYQIMAYSEEAMAKVADGSRPAAHSRKLTYVKNFLRLVKEYHRKERAITFYADKMCISPKYMSLIIKEATGKSAAQWIDEYVLQEAKNLLRYSGKNVQQIAYELNFTNQSSFGKYFKNLTGLSPTQFQNM